MTNILLIIIAVLLAVRIVLQVRQGKRAFEKGYAAPSEVEHLIQATGRDYESMNGFIKMWEKDEWELVSVMDYAPDITYLFFTRKKIKNFYEE